MHQQIDQMNPLLLSNNTLPPTVCNPLAEFAKPPMFSIDKIPQYQDVYQDAPAPPPLCREYGIDNNFLEPKLPKEFDTKTPEGKAQAYQQNEANLNMAALWKLQQLSNQNRSLTRQYINNNANYRHLSPHQLPQYQQQHAYQPFDAELPL